MNTQPNDGFGPALWKALFRRVHGINPWSAMPLSRQTLANAPHDCCPATRSYYKALDKINGAL